MEKDKRRLLLVRDTVFEARRLASGQPLDFDRMRAVWLADLAVELTLAAIASDNGLHPKQANQNFRFEDYFSAIGQQTNNSDLQNLKQYFPRVRSLHKDRNRVHDGVAISTEDTKRAVTIAETFISAAFAGLYGVDLEHMSLSSFLTDSKAKTWLEQAQELVNSGDCDGAAFHVAIAFENATKQIRTQLYIGRKTELWQGDGSRQTTHTLTAGSVWTQSDPRLTRISFAIEVSRFGISIPEAIDFLDSLMPIGSAPGTDEDNIKSWIKFDNYPPYTQKVVMAQIEFITELLYRLQQNWQYQSSFSF